MMSESEVDMVLRHIREGEQHVTRQREIIAQLSGHHQSTDQAEDLLDLFLLTLAQHRAHFDRIRPLL